MFKILIATAKAKVTPLVTKIKMWTSWNFIRTKLVSKIRDLFSKLLDVRPRHKKDYYEVFRWLVSKRLAMAAVVIIGLLSMYYLYSVHGTVISAKLDGIKTYPYDSILLRFANEKVRITGKSGYLAYEVDVRGGGATGYGTLMNPAGVVVYQGNFVKNRYQGNGTRYYDDGVMMYTGNFQENLFNGVGKYYRENGSLMYDGEFALGKKDGQGKLYDSGSSLIYTGGFSQDELVYSQMLGKKVSEMAKVYTGKRILYEGEDMFAVLMEDIEAMYVGQNNSGTLDGEMSVECVIVLKDTFAAGGKSYTSVDELQQYFGTERYEGNSEIKMAEAVAVNWMQKNKNRTLRPVDMTTSSEYEDYVTINRYNEDYTVYLYSFNKEGLLYTFVCQDKGDTFSFYFIEKEEAGTAG